MLEATFTEFRNNAAQYLDKAENGETVVITRHRRAVAELNPVSPAGSKKSWQRPALRLNVKGLSLSRAVLSGRKERV